MRPTYRPVLGGNSFVAAAPASLAARAREGATWRDPGRLDAVVLDRFGAGAWHYQREQGRPDQPWRRAGLILDAATGPGALAWDAAEVLHALVPGAAGVAHLTLGPAGWRPVDELPGVACALGSGADGVLLALTRDAAATRAWQHVGNTWVLRGRLEAPATLLDADPTLVPASASDELLPGSRLAPGRPTAALPAGWFPTVAASVARSHLGDPLRRGRGWLQALVQEGDAVYQYHQQRAAGRTRWLRSACLRLDPDEMPAAVAPRPSTKLAQITGERDTQPGRASSVTLTRSLSRSGIRGADLGVRFDVGERSFLLFGDTHWGRHAPLATTLREHLAQRQRRLAAFTAVDLRPTALATAARGLARDARELATALRDASRITLDSIAEIHPDRGVTGLPGLPDIELHGAPLRITGGLATRREYDVPLDAFAHDGDVYVFYSTGHGARHQVMGHSILTRVVDPALPVNGAQRRRPIDLRLLGVVSDRHFINVSLERVGDHLYVWGSGAYRADDLYLARLDLTSPAVHAVLHRRCPPGAPPSRAPLTGLAFFAGLDADGAPRWTSHESDAAPIAPGAVGELSVRWIEELRAYAWLGMDAPEDPAGVGVMLRLASQPWGPWGPRIKLFDWRADGQSFDDPTRRFIKAHPEGDPVGDAIFGVQARSTGAAYAPYFFDAHRSGDDVVLRYTLSTWNPYQSVLMEHRLPLAPSPSCAPGVEGCLGGQL